MKRGVAVALALGCGLALTASAAHSLIGQATAQATGEGVASVGGAASVAGAATTNATATVTAAATVELALGAASELPSPRLLEQLMGGPSGVAMRLQEIGLDPNRPIGVRLRALASLVPYAGLAARESMRSLLDGLELQPVLAPSEIWLARAALEVLAACGDALDVPRMTNWLEREDARDVRARAAWALGRLGEAAGLEALRKRFLRETVGQVKFQIAAALEQLGA